MRKTSRLLLALAILQALDLLSTLLLIGLGGQEANPVSAWLLRQGIGTFIAAKLTLAFVLLALVSILERERRPKDVPAVNWTCLGMDVVYAFAVLSNLLQVALFA